LKKSLAALPAVLSVSIAGVLSACSPVVSVQPLYTQAEIQKPYLNQLVEGEWIMANLDDSHEDAATHKPPCTFAGPAQEQLFLLEIFGRANGFLVVVCGSGPQHVLLRPEQTKEWRPRALPWPSAGSCKNAP